MAAQRHRSPHVLKAAMSPTGQRLPVPTWAGAMREASGSCPQLLPVLQQVDQLWFGNWMPCGWSKKQDTGVWWEEWNPPPYLGLCDKKRKTMNVAAPKVNKVLICDLEPRAHTPLQGCNCRRGWGCLSAQHLCPWTSSLEASPMQGHRTGPWEGDAPSGTSLMIPLSHPVLQNHPRMPKPNLKPKETTLLRVT